jgi:hypothetical protein
MKRPFSVILIISLFLFSTVTVSLAGSRHGYRSYNTHYRTGYPYHRVPTGHNYPHANHFFPYFGAGMLTGALIGSAISVSPRPRTIYYSSPPRAIVQSESIVTPQYTPVTPSAPQELVLRQVKIIAKIVNIRSGPGLENTVINQAHRDETVDVIGVSPDWLYVKTQEGQYGWLMTQYTLEVDRPVG